MPPYGGILDRSNWEETLGWTQNMLEVLYTPSGLRMPKDSPRIAGGGGQGEGLMGYLAQHPAITTLDGWTLTLQISGRKQMDGYSYGQESMQSFYPVNCGP